MADRMLKSILLLCSFKKSATQDTSDSQRQIQNRQMLIRTIDKPLIHLRKCRNDLVFLKIRNSLVENNPSVQLQLLLAKYHPVSSKKTGH